MSHSPLPAGAGAPGAASVDTDWYRDAVIYQVHVKSFFDGNDDGIGDFRGLLAKLDYIASLGVDTLWLLPFYPSPRKDDGYDVADYLGVHPDYGDAADLKRFLDAAHARGLRVIGDLVLNHTSDQHPWFQRARSAPRDSVEHAFYVWSDDDQKYPGTRIIFPDVEKSNWTWDAAAGRYYFHRFYAHQPDLNFDNPQVLEAILAVLRHWLDAGLDGFRLDAVAYLVERDGTSNENLPETHAILKRLRAEIDAHYPDRMLLAEANQWPEDMQDYFGADDECHMAFHFPLMPRMYMAVAQEDRFPITDILRQTPPTPPRSQWAIFLRNHDELTLEMVTDAERDYLWNTYAADPRARINLGIRRRLAPLLERDRRRIELLTALLLTLPGTPVLYYGDEIGMGDNIHLGDRDGVRTPMQWSVDRNGGFSRADAQRLVLPAIMDPLYGYASVNVESQERDPHSLLHWTRRLLAVRRRYGQLFGRGELRFLHPRNRKVLVYLREWQGRQVLCVANLARTLQAVEVDLSEFAGHVPVDLLGGAALPPVATTPYLLTLPPYGCFLLELAGRERLPDWYVPEPERLPELPTLVLRGSLAGELEGAQRGVLERELLPAWLRRHGGRCVRDGGALPLTRVHALDTAGDTLLLEVDDGQVLATLAIAWEGEAEAAALAGALARVRRGPRVGHLVDALTLRRVLLDWRAAWEEREPSGLALRLVAEEALVLPAPRSTSLDLPPGDGNLQPVLLDRALLLQFARCRGAADGPLELARQLRRLAFPHVLPLLGRIELGGSEECLGFVRQWLPTRGDAAQWTLDFLRRALHEAAALPPERRPSVFDAYLPFAKLLGERLRALHRALADADPADDAFLPAQARVLSDACAASLRESGVEWRDRLPGFDARATAAARRVRALGEFAAPLAVQRVHGHASLANVLLTVDDVLFVNLVDPDPRLRSGATLRAPALADVADLLYGFDHASAVVAHERGDDPLSLLLDGFRGSARRALLEGYRGRAAAAEERRALRLLRAHRAAVELRVARHAGAAEAALQALGHALDATRR